MPYSVRCKACSSSFAIPDEIWDKRVRGRVATLKCRSCKAEIQVDGTKPSLSQPPSSAPASNPDVANVGSDIAASSRNWGQTSLSSKTAGAPGVIAKAADATASIGTPGSKVPILGVKPVAKAAEDVAAADLGWSMVPPAAELQSVGISPGRGTATATKQPSPDAAAPAHQGSALGREAQHELAKQSVDAKNAAATKTPKAVTATKTTKAVIATTQTKQPEASIATSIQSRQQTVAATTQTKQPEASIATSIQSRQQTVTATTQTKQPEVSAATSVQPKLQTAKAGTSTLASNVVASAAATPVAGKALSTTATSKPEAREKVAATPAAPTTSANESEPSLADLWVVSYGDDDDRELTEKQIAAELVRGNITTSTIVWHEGMPEWLPISGVDALAKYAPTPKPAPRLAKQSSARSQPRSAVPQPTSSLVAKSSAGTPAASAIPRPTAATASREPKSPLRRESKSSPSIAEPGPQLPTESRKPSPPPLPKSGVSHERPAPTEASINPFDDTGREIAASPVDLTAEKSGTRPPALPRRAQGRPSPASPWDEPEAESVEDVFTSAPDVGAIQSVPTESHAHGSPPGPALTQPSPLPVPAAVAPSETSQAQAASAPKTSPGKVSFPPPKPVQTATSTVMRTEASTGTDRMINDEEFLAMQRRLPKWAIPVGIVAVLAVVAGLVYLLQSKEELPPLPVAPVVVPPPTPSIGNTAEPSLPSRGSTNAVNPPAASIAPTSDEKDFAKLFAQSVGKATGGFDAKAAESAAKSAIDAASRCRHAPEPPGRAQVVVTFATSGQVLSVQVAPPHTKTATGACIVAALQPVKITPFQGRPGRLTLTIPLR